MSDLCLLLAHFRQFADNLGWPQQTSTIFMDSKSAINLAQAPIVTKKARHMKARYHLTREFVSKHIVALVHIPSDEMRVDVLTKILSKTKFLHGRRNLLNMPL